jgi:hypothetical protein
MMSLSSAPTSQCLEDTDGAEGGLCDRVDLLSRARGSTMGRGPARPVDHCGDPASSPSSTNIAAGVHQNATAGAQRGAVGHVTDRASGVSRHR